MTVTLTIGGQRHQGWTEASVTRSLETISGAFSVTLTEREPGETTPRIIRPGDSCRVDLEDEIVCKAGSTKWRRATTPAVTPSPSGGAT